MFKVVKLMDKRVVPDSAKARHIYFKLENAADSSKVKAKADSVFSLLQQGAVFDSLAAKFSQDESNNTKGGELGMMELDLLHPLEIFFILGIRSRPSAFDVMDAQMIEPLGDLEFIVDGERDPFGLGPVS